MIVIAVGLGIGSAGCNLTAQRTWDEAAQLTGGDPAKGREALAAYGCRSCHTIPGVRGADALVGPPLTRMGSRVYIAGRLSNTPEHLMRWIQHPREIDPRTAMPETGVTDEDVRHIAAYLYTLR